MYNLNVNPIDGYLTESKLHKFLEEFLLSFNVIHDMKVPDSDCKYRPDFRIEELKLIIEFDGIFHYTNPSSVLSDQKKDEIFTKLGYKVKRIPYYIQLTSEIVTWIFDDYDTEFMDYTTYQHGFIDKKCPLPATFCSLGNIRYIRESLFFNKILEMNIEETLLTKIIEKESIATVVDFETHYIDLCNWFFNSSIGALHPEINSELSVKLTIEFFSLCSFYNKDEFLTSFEYIDSGCCCFDVMKSEVIYDNITSEDIFDYINENGLLDDNQLITMMETLNNKSEKRLKESNIFITVKESQLIL